MQIGRVAAGQVGSLAAGWFWAIHPMTIWYARDVKTYSWLATLAAIVIWCYLILQKRISKKWLWLALIFLSLGSLSHYYFFAFSMSLILLAFTTTKQSPRFFRRWVAITILSWLPLVIWLIWYLTQDQPALGSGWIQIPDWNDPFETLWNLISGYGGVASIEDTFFGLFVLMIILTGIIGIGPKPAISPLYIITIGMGAPLIGILLLSQRRPLYVDRYFIVLLPWVTLLFAQGIQTIWDTIHRVFTPRRAAWLSLTLFATLGIFGIIVGLNVLHAPKYQREDWRALATDLSQHAGDDPKVWFSDKLTIIPLKYYTQTQIQPIWSDNPPICENTCWWIIRQPFTYTHAFTQSVNPTNRAWIPELPSGCYLLDKWDYFTGILLWHVSCDMPP